MLTLVASVIIFGLLIFFHELGHFLVAKRVGIGVMELPWLAPPTYKE